jgi:predicted dehydrogenase
MAEKLRIGLIGAGAFTTGRMLPGFQQVPDVEVNVVVNRSQESGERVASQFGIPKVATDYRAVIEDPEIDAVFIGTPPVSHKDLTFAALDAGKHVLCQTRIATSVAEARDMQEAAEEARARGLISMLVPPAPFYRASRYVKHLVTSGYLGQLRHVMGFNLNASFADPNTPLSAGRSDRDLYGQFNAMQLGLTYDVMARWTGHARSLVAQRATFVAQRPLVAGGAIVENPFPDEVTVIAETTGGAIMQNVVNYSVRFAATRIELYGSEGTVVYYAKGDTLMGGHVGDEDLQLLAIPPEHDQPWLVEQEFARLVRGELKEPSFTFEDGVKNMAYLEAAYYSATEGRRVDLA